MSMVSDSITVVVALSMALIPVLASFSCPCSPMCERCASAETDREDNRTTCSCCRLDQEQAPPSGNCCSTPGSSPAEPDKTEDGPYLASKGRCIRAIGESPFPEVVVDSPANQPVDALKVRFAAKADCAPVGECGAVPSNTLLIHSHPPAFALNCLFLC